MPSSKRPIIVSLAATLAILLGAAVAFGLFKGPDRAPGIEAGRYRLVLSLPAGDLPVGLEIGGTPDAPSAAFINGSGRIAAERISWRGTALTLSFPSYDSSIELKAEGADRLSGTAHLFRRSGRVDVPAAATRNVEWRFFERPAAQPAALAGEWAIAPADPDGAPGLLVLRQDGNRIEGSVQYASGDERMLAGEVDGRNFALSTFDGNQGSVWRGTIGADGTIAGEDFGATSKAAERWTARRGTNDVAPIGVEKPPVDRISFTFPDADGRPVSLADPRYRGKVVVVAIGGSWCPNCHDEAADLVPYARAHAAAGLEVIGLSFEYTDDPVRNARQVKNFVARYGIPYPVLVAGVATPEGTRAALPAIGGVKIYPTTLFIDRKGRLREIHTGYSGPATGTLHDRALREFDALVSKLLAERA